MTINFAIEASNDEKAGPSRRVVSPLMLSDQLMTLAQDADQAGLRPVAGDLLRLALRICENRTTRRRPARRSARRSIGARLAAPIGGAA